ncbi:unnamed protein product [Dibothriocephalus latus]|uniref:Uncharacterized protein n=1 Tax=Dibothriocephalus latus TaxID=60516 RepID=A0A3P7LJ48_DIBLA|nr:unnamed protein product [Dibothriocephalus latus]
MIPIGLKATRPVDFRTPFAQFVESHYHQDAANFEEAFRQLNSSREEFEQLFVKLASTGARAPGTLFTAVVPGLYLNYLALDREYRYDCSMGWRRDVDIRAHGL